MKNSNLSFEGEESLFGLVSQRGLFKWKDHKLLNIWKDFFTNLEKYKEKLFLSLFRKAVSLQVRQVKHLIEIFCWSVFTDSFLYFTKFDQIKADSGKDPIQS